MLFKLFFRGQALSKKIFVASSCSLIAGCIVHWGIIKPLQKNHNAEHLEGSNPLLEKNKGDPYYEDLSEVNWTNNLKHVYENLPLIYPNLTKQHTNFKDPELNSEFDSKIRNSILQKTEDIKVGNDKSTVLKDARYIDTIERHSKMSYVSEIEIPYKSYFYNFQTRQLTKAHIIKDLIISLADEAEFNKTSIRPDSIKIDFQLEKIDESNLNEEVDKKTVPIKANKIREFKLSLQIYNPNNRVQYVFKSIPIQPYRETQVNIYLRNSEVRPLASSTLASWSLFPIEDNKFEISMEDSYPKFEVRKFSFPNLSLIYGRSHWIQTHPRTYMVNLPTYNDFYKLSIPYLSAITAKQAKKDIETFYGALFSWNIRLLIKDIQEIIIVMDTKNIEEDSGTKSTLEKILEDKKFRYGLYKFLYFGDNATKAAEKALTSEGVNAQAISTFLESTKFALEELLNNTTVSIKWHQEPKLSSYVEGDISPFPSISFDFSREVKWNKTIKLPFKGCWDSSNKTYTPGSKDCTGGNKKIFNLYALFEDKLQEILRVVMGDAPGLGLIPDAEQFLKIDYLEIAENESISTRYIAKNSPIKFALYNSWDNASKSQVLPGWKAMDISVSYDLSNFYKFFYKIYEKVDLFNDKNGIQLDNFWSAVSSISKLKNISKDFSTKGVSIVAHLINHLFASKPSSNSEESTRPFAVFFKTLLSEPITFNSTQFIVGWSTSMLDLEDWDIFSGKDYKLSSNWQSKEVNKKGDVIKDDWNYPIKFKSKKMEQFAISYMNNFSLFFPKSPIIFNIFNFGKYNKWNNFLNKQGSTNNGFIFYKDEIKNILKNFWDQEFSKSSAHVLPLTNLFNWNKVKLSVFRLKIGQALKSVLSLKYKDLATVVEAYAGWSKLAMQHMLGEFIQRDIMLVNINMMSEDFAINTISSGPLIPISNSSLSVIVLAVKPRIKCDELNDDFKKFVKKVGGVTLSC